MPGATNLTELSGGFDGNAYVANVVGEQLAIREVKDAIAAAKAARAAAASANKSLIAEKKTAREVSAGCCGGDEAHRCNCEEAREGRKVQEGAPAARSFAGQLRWCGECIGRC